MPERVSAIDASLVLIDEGEDSAGRVISLCQVRGNRTELIRRWRGWRGDLDDRIVAAAREIVYWAERGDLLDEIEKANDVLDEAKEREMNDKTDAGLAYHFDAILDRNHFAVNGLGAGIGGAAKA